MWNEFLQTDYEALLAGTAVACLENHFLIALTGEDRHSFLHNFCTADIKALDYGECHEAFILNEKGKTLTLANVLAFEDAIWLVGAGATSATSLIEHLDRYIIREDVQVANLTDQTDMYFAPNYGFMSEVSEMGRNECRLTEFDTTVVRIAQIEVAGFGLWLACTDENVSKGTGAFGFREVDIVPMTALQSIRIEKGTPWSGTEANETNLPQELQRDEKAISFKKGCYLGQETVARLDALGRVNQLLVRVRFDDDNVSSGSELLADEKIVGRVSSVAWSPRANSLIGFAYVRRAFAKDNALLNTELGAKATVVNGT